MKYIVISKEDALAVAEGKDIELSFGKRISRTLTIKTDVERKMENLKAKYDKDVENLQQIEPIALVQTEGTGIVNALGESIDPNVLIDKEVI